MTASVHPAIWLCPACPHVVVIVKNEGTRGSLSEKNGIALRHTDVRCAFPSTLSPTR